MASTGQIRFPDPVRQIRQIRSQGLATPQGRCPTGTLGPPPRSPGGRPTTDWGRRRPDSPSNQTALQPDSPPTRQLADNAALSTQHGDDARSHDEDDAHHCHCPAIHRLDLRELNTLGIASMVVSDNRPDEHSQNQWISQ